MDTRSNESGHKVEKTAAKLTQKKKGIFDIWTAKHLEEVRLIDLAMEEINGEKLWECDEDCRPTEQEVEKIRQHTLVVSDTMLNLARNCKRIWVS